MLPTKYRCIQLGVCIFVCALSAQAQSLQCPVDYGYQWTRGFGDTKASVDIRRFTGIAPMIRQRIEKQLRDRVGATFFKRLKFEYGHAEDVDKSDELKLSQANRIDGYDLVFQFSDRRKGLSAFHFKVEADGTGKLFDRTLPLPNIADNAKKGQLISCSQAMEIARKNGFPAKRSSIIFVYDWDTDAFTWVITDSRAVQPDQPISFGKGTYRKIDIEAHSGKILKIHKETIIV